jgi:light-regulated signal transduction histidine kinase (bacteriophytochrome)
MQEEQLFLQPSLSLGDVAEKLNTNKTYVSKMVNNTYNLGFPELLNTLRIDYAQQYILNHRGAKQDEIAHIFDRFVTGANNGAGLGLSICHELVEYMGGQIELKSTEGKGTMVWFSIPCKLIELERC